jgi:Zn-dependent membrane protease YugP
MKYEMIVVLITYIMWISLYIYYKNIEMKLTHNKNEINELLLCKEMIEHYCLPEIIIEEKQKSISSFNPIKKSITIRKNKNISIASIMIALHEGGHYISLQTGNKFARWSKRTIWISIINRLFIIPFLTIYFFTFITCNISDLPFMAILILSAFFYAASLNRLITCIPIERDASKIALSFMKYKGYVDESNEALLNKYIILSFLTQFVLSLVWVSIITTVLTFLFIKK